MDEHSLTPLVAHVRGQAAEAESPASILKWLRDQLGTPLPYAAFYWCIVQPFHVPLETLRQVEMWTELWPQGSLTDLDVDLLLSHWTG